MLAFQLMLTAKHGLPLSRLLGQQGTDAKSTNKAKLLKQDEVAKRVLKVEKRQKESIAAKVKEEKEDKACFKEGVPSSDSSFFCLLPLPTSSPNPASSQPFLLLLNLHSLARCLLPTGSAAELVKLGAMSSPFPMLVNQ